MMNRSFFGTQTEISWLPPGPARPTALRLAPLSEIDPNVPIDYHLHTNYTDGSASPAEMADAASLNGIAEMLFTEHVRHTSTFWPDFKRDVDDQKKPNLNTLTGIETKVLDMDGSLDCPTAIVPMCDAIVASVHRPPDTQGANSWHEIDVKSAVELEFRMAMSIVNKSRANILAHPMGMTVSRLGLQPLDQLYALARACKETDKAFELNTRYCANPKTWIDIVTSAGCSVSIGSDAHRTEDVGSAWRLFVLKGGYPS